MWSPSIHTYAVSTELDEYVPGLEVEARNSQYLECIPEYIPGVEGDAAEGNFECAHGLNELEDDKALYGDSGAWEDIYSMNSRTSSKLSLV